MQKKVDDRPKVGFAGEGMIQWPPGFENIFG